MKSLANLSSGDISIEDITTMESLILKNLKWEMCPPTAPSFCSFFHALLPSDIKPSVAQAILQRSLFFTELSLFEYSLISFKPSEIAFAATLNAIDGLDDSLFSLKSKESFVDYIAHYCRMDDTSHRINALQVKMMALYRRSKQFSTSDLRAQYRADV